MSYNPFNKSINEKLTIDDLYQLIKLEVSEGYYIEYKSDFPDHNKIGKSIASFANTYGGWYFVGIEANKTNNVATNICGFSVDDVHDPIDKIREVIKSYINPVPVFYPKVVSLEKDNKVVLVVYVPDNQETPFINKDGRIYRRIADSSNLVYEKDRNSLDRLVDNGREVRKKFGEFCQDNRTFSENESHPWVKVFLSPYPDGIIDKFDVGSEEVVEKLIKLSETSIEYRSSKNIPCGYCNIPFNFGQPTFNFVILNQVDLGSLTYNSLSVEFFNDGKAKFFIPLQRFFIDYHEPLQCFFIDNLEQVIESPKVKQIFLNLWDKNESNLRCLSFFDIGILFTQTVSLFNYYREWIGNETCLISLKICIKFKNTWRIIPFFDWDEWAVYVEKYGLPIVRQDIITIPNDLNHAIPIDINDIYSFWIILVSFIGLTFHLPMTISHKIMFEALKRGSTPVDKWKKNIKLFNNKNTL